MKMRFAFVVIIFAIVVLFANVNIAQAQWNALSSGYAVTTDWHGTDMPIGEEVTAYAGTNDTEVEEVLFEWLDPVGNPFSRPEDLITSLLGPFSARGEYPAGVPEEILAWADDHEGVEIYLAISTPFEPDVIGDWAVKALFLDHSDPVKNLRGRNTDIIACRATSFNVVSEVPFGTIVIFMSMLGTVGIFALKRRNSIPM